MCLTGFLAELLCSVAESTEEVDEITTVVKEIKQSISGVVELEKLNDNSSSNVDISNRNASRCLFLLLFLLCCVFVIPMFFSDHKTDEKAVIVKNIVGAAIQANPTVSAIKNTVGAVQDYRDGEEISDIVIDR